MADLIPLASHLDVCEGIPSLLLQMQIKCMKRMSRKYLPENRKGFLLIFSFLERGWKKPENKYVCVRSNT